MGDAYTDAIRNREMAEENRMTKCPNCSCEIEVVKAEPVKEECNHIRIEKLCGDIRCSDGSFTAQCASCTSRVKLHLPSEFIEWLENIGFSSFVKDFDAISIFKKNLINEAKKRFK